MKKVIVTGVTGQDGSNMVDYLLRETDHIIIGGVRRLSVKNHQNIEHLEDEDRFFLIDLDVTDAQNTDEVIAEHKPDYFINFAANSFVGTSWKMPTQHMETNGSSEEFGDVIETPQSEKHPLRPRSPYGASKCSARHLVKVYRDSYDLYAVQGWLFNHEGTRRGEEFVTRKITTNVARISYEYAHEKKFKPLTLGNVDSKRDWSDSEDFMDGIWRMLNQDQFESYVDNNYKPKEYVLSSDETHTIREFVEEAFHIAGFHRSMCRWEGKGVHEKYYHGEDLLVAISDKFYRPAEVDLLYGDSSKARNELNWKPQTDFTGLVTKMVKNDLELASV